MSIILHIDRKPDRSPILAVEIVHSLDDNSYYLGETDFVRGKRRVSADTYLTPADAAKAWRAGFVKWED